MDTQGDFYYSEAGDYVDMYSAGNPGTFYTHIEACQKMDAGWGMGGPILLGARSYITIRNMAIKNFSYHGLVLGEGSNHITVEDCDFSFIGGSYDPGSTVPDGNGIMTWKSVSDLTIRHNTFREIWETAVSMQSNVASAQTVTRIYVYGNTIAKAAGAVFDYWMVQGTVTADELYWSNNTICDTGGGQLAARRGGTPRGFTIYAENPPANAHILNNIWHTSDNWYIYGKDGLNLSRWDIDYNCYFPDKVTAFAGDPAGQHDLAGWKAWSGKDAHSISSDPQLVNAAGEDFQLGAASPCLGTGLLIAGMSEAPNMGAF